MEQVQIQTAPPYSVYIGDGLLSHCGSRIREATGSHRCVLVTDSNVAPLYSDVVLQSMREAGLSCSLFVFPAGETSKNLGTYYNLLNRMAAEGLTRTDCVAALGGGVTGDLAGFAAATYQRGIPWVQLPTTLLAASDASVGGKTAVDLPCGKNLAGAFWQPRLVLCDTEVLRSLPEDLFSQGMAETIKHGLIADSAFFYRLVQENGRAWLHEMVRRNIEIKAQLVAADERDRGVRRLLNFGHTLGHALEVLSDYRISHGEAVATGMVLAARGGESLGITAAGTSRKIVSAVERYGLSTSCPFDADALAEAAWGDKKRRGELLDLVVLTDIGRATIFPVNITGLRAFVEAAL